MLADRLFRKWDDAWVVHVDEHLVVIDKPAGVSSQSADPELPDDVPHRVASWLASRGEPSKLGVHQRLDRETSGVMVLSRTKEASAALAKQFEGRDVEKKYVACVVGWTRAQAILEEVLAPGDDGRMVVTSRNDRRGKPARTRVRLLERVSDRQKVELVLETGRTHQARVQLAHARAAIAGDPLYGSVHAPRLMLHASALTLTHPSGKRVTYQAPTPRELTSFMKDGDRGERLYDDASALDRALERAAHARFGLFGSKEGVRRTTAFRLVNEDGDGLPGLAVDVYDEWLVAQLYGDRPWRQRALDALGRTGARGVYLKVRPKQANTLADTRTEDLAPKLPVIGEPAPDPLPMLEEGAPYLVSLGDGLSTGIFLDQRSNRRRVRGMAEGKRVLNLFAYTAGFTAAAALGGARATVTVDASMAALERGRANLAHAGIPLDPKRHAFVADDAFAWLARAAKKGERFDLVILDPPSYSVSKSRRFVAESDYADLAALALSVMNDRAVLLACTNHRGIRAAKFRRLMFDALRTAGREASQVKDLPPPHDYPAALGFEPHLKSVWVTLR